MLTIVPLRNNFPYITPNGTRGTGACAAMVIFWVKATLDLGRPIKTAAELTGGSPIEDFYQKCIASHIWFKNFNYSPASYGDAALGVDGFQLLQARNRLFCDAGLSMPDYRTNVRMGNFDNVALSFIGLSSVGEIQEGIYSCDVPGKHAVGLYLDPKSRTFQLLEPEFGLLQTNDYEDFMVGFKKFYYNDIRERFTFHRDDINAEGLGREQWFHRAIQAYRWPLPGHTH
jgi:hypothetical protein